MRYSVEFRPAVLKSLEKLPRKDLVRLKRRIDELGADPSDPAATKLKGDNTFHKIRVGDYRIIYEIQEARLVILVVKIGHRRDVYRNLG